MPPEIKKIVGKLFTVKPMVLLGIVIELPKSDRESSDLRKY